MNSESKWNRFSAGQQDLGKLLLIVRRIGGLLIKHYDSKLEEYKKLLTLSETDDVVEQMTALLEVVYSVLDDDTAIKLEGLIAEFNQLMRD